MQRNRATRRWTVERIVELADISARRENLTMDIDTDKIDDAVLALLYLTRCDTKYRTASWKGHDWDALRRLHEKGYIGDPVSRSKSVALTDEGAARSEALFRELFGKRG